MLAGVGRISARVQTFNDPTWLAWASDNQKQRLGGNDSNLDSVANTILCFDMAA